MRIELIDIGILILFRFYHNVTPFTLHLSLLTILLAVMLLDAKQPCLYLHANHLGLIVNFIVIFLPDDHHVVAEEIEIDWADVVLMDL